MMTTFLRPGYIMAKNKPDPLTYEDMTWYRNKNHPAGLYLELAARQCIKCKDEEPKLSWYKMQLYDTPELWDCVGCAKVKGK